MASKVSIEKYNYADLPIDTSNDIYRLQTRTIKENNYLIIHQKTVIFMFKCMKMREYHSKPKEKQ